MDLTFAAIALPGGVNDRLKLALCFSPRWQEPAGPADRKNRSRGKIYEDFPELLERFVADLITGAGKKSAAIEFNGRPTSFWISRHWNDVWKSSAVERAQIWKILLPPSIETVSAWAPKPTYADSVLAPSSGPETKQPAEKSANEVVRQGKATIELPGLHTLKGRIEEIYPRIALELAKSGENIEEIPRATEEFKKIAAGLELQLDRVVSHGTVQALPSKLSPAGNGDLFYQVIARLQNFPRLQKLLGLIVEIEVEVPKEFREAGNARQEIDITVRLPDPWEFDRKPPVLAAVLEMNGERPERFETFRRAGNEASYDWLGFDALGLALQSLSALRTPTTAEHAPSGPPALRAAGQSLIFSPSMLKPSGRSEEKDLLGSVKHGLLQGKAGDNERIEANMIEIGEVVELRDWNNPMSGWSCLNLRQSVLEIGIVPECGASADHAPPPTDFRTATRFFVYWLREPVKGRWVHVVPLPWHSSDGIPIWRMKHKDREDLLADELSKLPLDRLDAEHAVLPLSLSQTPQPLTGVVLADITPRNYADDSELIREHLVCVATPIGDWIVSIPRRTKAKEIPNLNGEYRFIGQLEEASSKMDFRLLAEKWEEIGEGRSGVVRIGKLESVGLAAQTFFHLEQLEQPQGAAAKASPIISGLVVPMKSGPAPQENGFQQVLSSKRLERDQLDDHPAVVTGHPALFASNQRTLRPRPRLGRLLRIEIREGGHALILESHELGEVEVFAPADRTRFLGVNPDGSAVSDPASLPAHGHAWIEITRYYLTERAEIAEAWLLEESREVQVSLIRNDGILLLGPDRTQIWIQKDGADHVEFRLELLDGLPALTQHGWDLLQAQLLTGERLRLLGRQAGENYIPVQVVRPASSSKMQLGFVQAVRADEERFRVVFAAPKKAARSEVRFTPGERGLKPRLGQFVWWSGDPEKNEAAPFFPASPRHERQLVLSGRIQEKVFKTTFGEIPLSEDAASSSSPAAQIVIGNPGGQAALSGTVQSRLEIGVLTGELASGGSITFFVRDLNDKQRLSSKPASSAGANSNEDPIGLIVDGETRIPVSLFARVTEISGDGKTARVKVIAWTTDAATERPSRYETLGAPIERELSTEGWSSEAKAVLKPGAAVVLEKPRQLFLAADPDKILFRQKQFENGFVVDSEGAEWIALRAWAPPNRDEEKATRTPRFDMVVRRSETNLNQLDWGTLAKLSYHQALPFASVVIAAPHEIPPELLPLPQEDQLFLSDAVLTWKNWSLVTSHPLMAPPEEEETAKPTSTDAMQALGLHLACVGDPPPGTLPRGRFGRRFEVNIRPLDLAGNVRESGSRRAEKRLHVLRYEPMGAPLIVAGTARSSGDGPDCYLPLRDPNAATPEQSQPLETVFATAALKHSFPVPSGSEEHWRVFPPGCGFDVLLAHGVLDGQPDVSFEILQGASAVPPEAGKGYPYSARDGRLPFLRDPSARRLAVRVRGTATREEPRGRSLFELLNFDGNWPRVKAIRLVARKATGGRLRLEAVADGLIIWVPPGEVCDVMVSPGLDADDAAGLDLFGLAHWVGQRDGRNQEALQAMREGRHPLISGKRQVRIVHAVDQPSMAPLFKTLRQTGVRSIGSRSVSYKCEVGYDPATTGRLLLHATWEKYEDDPRYVLPSVPIHEAMKCFDPLVERMTRNEMRKFFDTVQAWHQPGSNTGERFWLHIERTFPEFVEKYCHPISPQVSDALRVFSISSSEQKSLPHVLLERPESGKLWKAPSLDFQHVFDDTRHREVHYAVEALTCFEREFATPQSETLPPGRTSENKKRVQVLATTPPFPPDVAYVLPLFGRDAEPPPSFDHPHRRKGLGLRIFLRRPWYTSGQGEELALVFGTSDRPEKELREHLTEWGYDAVWYAPDDRGTHLPQPRPEWCLWATEQIFTRLARPTPANSPKKTAAFWEINLATHRVRFSPMRGLWYCDVLFTDEAPSLEDGAPAKPYMPFLRLALARFQRSAIPGAQLSEVRTVEFIQLQPSRSLTLRRGFGGHVRCEVDGPFPTHASDGQRRRVELLIHRPSETVPLPEAISGEWMAMERMTAKGRTVYVREIVLPSRNGSTPIELVVRECELHDTADRANEGRTIYTERVKLPY